MTICAERSKPVERRTDVEDESVFDERVMRGFPAPDGYRACARNLYEPPFTHWFMQHVREVERTAKVEGGIEVTALTGEPQNIEGVVVRRGDEGSWSVSEALRATFTDGFVLLHRG